MTDELAFALMSPLFAGEPWRPRCYNLPKLI